MVNSSLFRRIELQVLMNLTASAFGKKPERIWTHSNDEALKTYAKYTASHLREGADEALLQRMNNKAYKTGRLLRCLFLIRNKTAAQKLITDLYRNIGISLLFSDKGQDASGEDNLCFHRCYFSSHYTPAVCLAASALDDGIIRGIMGLSSTHLCFSQRITEGCGCCLATFQKTNKEQEI